MQAPIRIATVSDNPDPDWVWLRDLIEPDYEVAGRRLEWSAFTMSQGSPKALGRWRGVRALAKAASTKPFDLIVTHGPWTTAWVALAAGGPAAASRHLAFSFNFTRLPAGLRRRLMIKAFQRVDCFAVFTGAEKILYADYFAIPAEKLRRAPWGVAPPLAKTPAREIVQPYFAALGGEARDYALLFEAARALPHRQFVVIARPSSIQGLSPPPNLEVRFNLPFEQAWALVWHSEAAIIPLISRETPCGLVTFVGGMHLGKAQIVTDAAGAADYIAHNETGLLVPAGDLRALTDAIEILARDRALAERLGSAAKAYAASCCSETQTISFFKELLVEWFAN